MKVAELIELLKKMPQDAEVVMFDDGPAYYTPFTVYVWEKEGRLKGRVVID